MAGQLNIRTVKLGDSATPANNFLITTPAVPDGSLSIQTEAGLALIDLAAGKVSFPNQGQELTGNGYIKLPGGLILQWGVLTATTVNANTPVAHSPAWPIPFPTALLFAQAAASMPWLTGQILQANTAAPDKTYMSFYAVSSVAGVSFPVTYFGLGY